MKKKPVPAPIAVPAATTPELAAKAHEGTPQYGTYCQPPAAPAPPRPRPTTALLVAMSTTSATSKPGCKPP